MTPDLQRRIFADVTEGLRVLVVRDGIDLTDEQIAERATNIVAGLVGNYLIAPWPEVEADPARAVRQ